MMSGDFENMSDQELADQMREIVRLLSIRGYEIELSRDPCRLWTTGNGSFVDYRVVHISKKEFI